jgi:hypothetical protein
MEIERGQVVRLESFLDTHPAVELVRRYGNNQPTEKSVSESGEPRAPEGKE